MKVALLANANSIYTVDLTNIVHADDYVLLVSYEQIEEFFRSKYRGSQFALYEISKDRRLAPALVKGLRLVKAFVRIEREGYDAILFHAPSFTNRGRVISLISKCSNARKYVVFWGSDINTCPEGSKKNLLPLLSQCRGINLSTVQMRNQFRSLFGNKFDDRITTAQFGSPAFEAIRRNIETHGGIDKARAIAKEALGVPSEKCGVAVGFGGRREHNHLLVINELSKLSEESKSKLCLIVHFGYGGDSGYYAEVETALARCGIDYKLIREQLELEKVAELRLAMDIMIHAQNKDALSGSIRECLYAGVKILNPEWICYDELDEIGIEMARYGTFTELNDRLEALVNGSCRLDVAANSEKIYKSFSWQASLKEWRELLEK